VKQGRERRKGKRYRGDEQERRAREGERIGLERRHTI
tara:strand:- start:179 stop:289 length:111 start_codon:yes stop_codon:yes gene_type:complete